MGKFNSDKNLNGQRVSRSLAAISLAASLAAFGCTTNHNIGNGTPTRSGPEVRTAPTSGVTTGGESTTPVTPNPPMTSSYNRSEVLPAVTVKSAVKSASRSIRRLSPDEAAAVMAGRQALHGSYLGVVSPGAGNRRPYQSANIQTYQNPAMLTNPQVTINSTISSPATPIDGIADTGAVVVTSADGTATVTTGAATVTPTVTQASANTPSVTVASTGAGTTTTATTATTAPVTVTGTTTATGVRAGTVTSPVRIMRSTGNVTVTNAPARTAVTTGRSQ